MNRVAAVMNGVATVMARLDQASSRRTKLLHLTQRRFRVAPITALHPSTVSARLVQATSRGVTPVLNPSPGRCNTMTSGVGP